MPLFGYSVDKDGDLSDRSCKAFKKAIRKGNKEEIEAIVQFCIKKEVKTIILPYASLDSVPESISRITSLTYLILAGNNLNTLPSSFINLKHLEELYLNYNKFQEIPSFIFKMTWLKKIVIGYNQLTNLNDSIGNMKSLEWLNVSDNKLTSLPESLMHLEKLEYLNVTANPLKFQPETDKYGNVLGGREAILNCIKRNVVNSGLHQQSTPSLPSSYGAIQSTPQPQHHGQLPQATARPPTSAAASYGAIPVSPPSFASPSSSPAAPQSKLNLPQPTISELSSHSRWRAGMNRQASEAELTASPPGSFVLRPGSQQGTLSLSHKDASTGNIGHAIIKVITDQSHQCFYQLENKPERFSSIAELLNTLPLNQPSTSDAVEEVDSLIAEPFFAPAIASEKSVRSRLNKESSFIVQPDSAKKNHYHVLRNSQSRIIDEKVIFNPSDQSWAMESSPMRRFQSINALLNSLPVTFQNTRNPTLQELDWWFFDESFVSARSEWNEVHLDKLSPSYFERPIFQSKRVLHEEAWKQIRRTVNYFDLEGFGFANCIDSVVALNNPYLRSGFYHYFNQFADSSSNPHSDSLFDQSFSSSSSADTNFIWRKQIHDEAKRRAGEFRSTHNVMRGEHRGVSQTVALHGTSPEIARLIASAGLTKMYRPKEKKDFYGTGVYLTESLFYALLYSYLGLKHYYEQQGKSRAEARQLALASKNYAVVISYIQWRQSYPCIEDPHVDPLSLMKKPLKKGYDMHHTIVSPSKHGATVWTPQRVTPNGTPKAAEYCLSGISEDLDTEQVLPMYIVNFQLTEEVSKKMEEMLAKGGSAGAAAGASASKAKEEKKEASREGKEMSIGHTKGEKVEPRAAPSAARTQEIKKQYVDLAKGRVKQINEMGADVKMVREEMELNMKLNERKVQEQIDRRVEEKMKEMLSPRSAAASGNASPISESPLLHRKNRNINEWLVSLNLKETKKWIDHFEEYGIDFEVLEASEQADQLLEEIDVTKANGFLPGDIIKFRKGFQLIKK